MRLLPEAELRGPVLKVNSSPLLSWPDRTEQGDKALRPGPQWVAVVRSGNASLHDLLQCPSLSAENLAASRGLGTALKQFQRPEQSGQHSHIAGRVLTDLIER